MRTGIAVFWALASGPVVALLLHGQAAAWVTMLSYQAACALAAAAAGGRLGTRPPAPALLAVAALTTIAVFALGAGARWLGVAPPVPPLWKSWGLAPPTDVCLLGLYVLLNPWLEEWFWRGTLLGAAVKRPLGRAGAVSLSVVGFIPLHLVFLLPSFGVTRGLLFAGGVLVAASLWAALHERHGHAWWSAASHLGADLGVVLLYLFFLRH